jgi:hypothetical protein
MDDSDPIGKSRIAIPDGKSSMYSKTPICRTPTLWDPLPRVPVVWRLRSGRGFHLDFPEYLSTGMSISYGKYPGFPSGSPDTRRA